MMNLFVNKMCRLFSYFLHRCTSFSFPVLACRYNSLRDSMDPVCSGVILGLHRRCLRSSVFCLGSARLFGQIGLRLQPHNLRNLQPKVQERTARAVLLLRLQVLQHFHQHQHQYPRPSGGRLGASGDHRQRSCRPHTRHLVQSFGSIFDPRPDGVVPQRRGQTSRRYPQQAAVRDHQQEARGRGITQSSRDGHSSKPW